jgi:hypothetical protein
MRGLKPNFGQIVTRPRQGLGLRLAHHGTLSPGEIGDTPLELQPKLLRARVEMRRRLHTFCESGCREGLRDHAWSGCKSRDAADRNGMRQAPRHGAD